MNWDDLRIFVAIARAGGLVAASRRVGLDHTTVARRLSALEGAVGAKLVHRSPRGAKLTDAGAGLLEHAERIEAEALAAAEKLGAESQRPAGAVRLATPEAFGAWLVAPHVKALHERHPGVTLELVPEARAVNLSKREADIAVSLSRAESGRLYTQKLADYRLGLFASRDYLESVGPIAQLSELKDHPLVWYIDDLIDIPQLKFLDQVVAGARPVFRSSSIAAQQAAVASGLGLGVLHVFAAAQDPRLVRILPEAVAIERSYWLVLHADQRHLPRIRAVVDFLHELVRTDRHRL
ncbi:LysR family transcriptional regulator [Phenylobacterium sp.]|jgi:DNA-binding transcriptional LysR family regulator|uniref:LysR family transcriptional regulator n=1 Tax=Phenylobacterium sp. TaxID=1871053 RepID=UPI003783EFFE